MLSKQDNNSESMTLIDYLSDSYTDSIIFTTQTQKTTISLTKNNIIQINEMSQDNVMKVLRKTLLQTDLLNNENTVTRLLNILIYLSLAIIQTVSYINKNNISIMKYIELCESSKKNIIEVLSQNFEDEDR